MPDIERLIQADRFYFPAIYDFLFLERHFHDTTGTHRITAAIEFPIKKDGIVVNVIADMVPYPDLLHFIQTSHAFAEKGFKFLICVQQQGRAVKEIREYGHNLFGLVADYRNIASAFFARLASEGLVGTLDAISQIDFVELRYLGPHRQTSQLNAIRVGRLNEEIMTHIKAIRFQYYYSQEETRKRISANGDQSPRIVIQCPLLEEPWPTVGIQNMRKIHSSLILEEQEKAVITEAYLATGSTFQLREDLSRDQRMAVFQILRKVGMVTPDLNTVSIEIQPKAQRPGQRDF